jgi:very-short-patch-repair endonuclease
MTAEQVRHRRRTGLWVPFAGAALQHRDLEPDALADAFAVALTWPDAVTCLTSAARVHRLPVPDGPVNAVVPTSQRRLLNLVPHRYHLDPADVVRQAGVAVTSLRRTVLDCLGLLPRQAAEELLVWTQTRRLATCAELAALLKAGPRQVGNRQRRDLLALIADGAMSVAEQRLHRILRAALIRGWLADAPVSDRHGSIGVADVLFPAERVLIEVDGMAYHAAARFQEDRTRQNRLVCAGYTVLRFTWGDLVDRPQMVRRVIEDAISSSRRRTSECRRTSE